MLQTSVWWCSRQLQEGCSECLQAPERAQTLPICFLLRIYLNSERLRIAMATPITNCKEYMLKPRSAHTLRAFLSSSYFLHRRNPFWADGPTAALSWTLCVLGALCSLALGGWANAAARGVSGNIRCLFSRYSESLQWNHPVQWLFLVPGYLGGVRSETAGLALLCLKDSPLPQPGKLWCVFCVPEFQGPGRWALLHVVGVVRELLPWLFLTLCSGRLLTSSQKQLLFSYTPLASA